MKTPTKTTDPGAPMTAAEVKEIVDGMLRAGFSQQARDLEAHLRSIHERLVRLETTPR